MSTTVSNPSALPTTTSDRPPFPRAVQRVAGMSLVMAGLLNGGVQYVDYLVAGDQTFVDALRDGTGTAGDVDALLVASALFMPIGLLGVAHLCRFGAPRLTAMATPLVVWGMWGFAGMLSMGYLISGVAVEALSVDQAVDLTEAVQGDPLVMVLTVLPHLMGSFFGLVLLCVAAWRSGAFPRPAVALLLAFLVADFLLEPVGPFEAHLLLAVAWSWMGWHLLRASDADWTGRHTR